MIFLSAILNFLLVMSNFSILHNLECVLYSTCTQSLLSCIYDPANLPIPSHPTTHQARVRVTRLCHNILITLFFYLLSQQAGQHQKNFLPPKILGCTPCSLIEFLSMLHLHQELFSNCSSQPLSWMQDIRKFDSGILHNNQE